MNVLKQFKNAKEHYLRDLGEKLADPATGQKTYWKILNKFLNKCKISRIPPLFVQDNLSQIVIKKHGFLIISLLHNALHV